MQSVIYLFVSPSGRAYAGRHTCQHEGWPRRGSGALPSGYRGSGKLWANVTRRHGPAIRWIILRRFGSDAPRADIDAAERRAIRLARHLWGERCVNIHSGGQGLTSEEARALGADPAVKARQSAGLRDSHARPEVKARRSAANKAAGARPEVKAKHKAVSSDPVVKARRSAASKAAAARPEVKAKHRASLKAYAATPEGQAAIARLVAAAQTPEARAKAEAANARPEVKQRRSAASRAIAATPEAQVRLAAMAAASRTPEALAKLSASNKAHAATPAGRAHLAAMQAASQTPTARERRSATCAARKEATAWHSPCYDAAEALREVEALREARRAAQTARLQELWADPEWAAAARARLKEAVNRPEVKAKHKAAMPAASAKRSATCAAKREATAWRSPFHNKE